VNHQTLYRLSKIEKMQAALQEGEDTKVEQALGDFCLRSESPAECLERYKRASRVELLMLRDSKIKSEDAISRLRNLNEGGTAFRGGVAPAGAELRDESRAPQVSTLDELKIHHQTHGQKKIQASDQLKWSRELVLPVQDLHQNSKPSGDPRLIRFSKTGQALPRDPSNPASGKLQSLDPTGARDPEAKRLLDQQFLTDLKKDQEEFQSERKKAPELSRVSGPSTSTMDSLSLEAFAESRAIILRTFEKSKNSRKPAAKPVTGSTSTSATSPTSEGSASPSAQTSKPKRALSASTAELDRKDPAGKVLSADTQKFLNEKVLPDTNTSHRIVYPVERMLKDIEDFTQ
jgi:hypothetical protein